jgi:Na+/H+-dicarboxylate symporter
MKRTFPIYRVDELMDMGRTCVNLLGNCLATIFVTRREGEFDDKRGRVFGTPVEGDLDLESGEVAFANAVEQGD